MSYFKNDKDIIKHHLLNFFPTKDKTFFFLPWNKRDHLVMALMRIHLIIVKILFPRRLIKPQSIQLKPGFHNHGTIDVLGG